MVVTTYASSVGVNFFPRCYVIIDRVTSYAEYVQAIGRGNRVNSEEKKYAAVVNSSIVTHEILLVKFKTDMLHNMPTIARGKWHKGQEKLFNSSSTLKGSLMRIGQSHEKDVEGSK